MANTLTDLAGDIYTAAEKVGRELTGFIPSVSINAEATSAALNDTVRASFTGEVTATDTNSSMTLAQGVDQTITNKTMTLSRSKEVIIPVTGEDMKHLNNGVGYEFVKGKQIEQAMRTIINLIEVDLATEAYQNASRARGTAGTAPFASNFNIVNEASKDLKDNGFDPMINPTSLVVNTTAGLNFRNLASLNQANTSGSDTMLRQGIMLPISNIGIRESGQVQSHTKGTGASFLVNGALAIGATAITVDTGTGTILAGDVITFAGDTNKYVVATALAANVVTIAAPGLQEAAADNAAITVGATYTGNVMINQDAIELAIRAPEAGIDAATDVMTVQDPHSGLVFEIRHYLGQRKNTINVAATWGYKAWRPEGIVNVLG